MTSKNRRFTPEQIANAFEILHADEAEVEQERDSKIMIAVTLALAGVVLVGHHLMA